VYDIGPECSETEYWAYSLVDCDDGRLADVSEEAAAFF